MDDCKIWPPTARGPEEPSALSENLASTANHRRSIVRIARLKDREEVKTTV
jgi:hypothetical protein